MLTIFGSIQVNKALNVSKWLYLDQTSSTHFDMLDDCGVKRQQHLFMNPLKYILVLSFAFCFSQADEQKKLLNEFSAGAPYYGIRYAKSGKRYFVLPVGPCACGGSSPFVQCTTELERELAVMVQNRKNLENATCSTNAGCRLGHENIYAECSQRSRRP